MRNTVDTAWERGGWGGNSLEHADPNLDVCRWSFAYLPDARMKSVAAGWMARVLLGADPAEMNEEELQMVVVSSLMASRDTSEYGLRCDA
ncbi:MAG TPA: hypothetical protein VMD92_04355 [Acidobacteriaceae bacterium]|jgi:hypothetical protein|nr:hypothetical protein [Acidobacteriaceae bacterium]